MTGLRTRNPPNPLFTRGKSSSHSTSIRRKSILRLLLEQWLRRDPTMECEKDGSHWDADYGKLEVIKRRAFDYPLYVPAVNEQGELTYLDTSPMFWLLPKEGDDYPLKKQKLQRWKEFMENQSNLDTQYEVNTSTSYTTDCPNGPESRRSDSLDSTSDRVFSSPSSHSVSSSRSSSRTRNSETTDTPIPDPQEANCHSPISNEQATETKPTTRISRFDWPTSISSIDQPLVTVASLTVENGEYRVPLTTIDGNRPKCNSFSFSKTQLGNDELDQSSFSRSNSRDASVPDESSSPEADGQSTQGDGSTNSKTSSHASDTQPGDDRTSPDHKDKLEAFIKGDVLRADPVVADIFYKDVEGKLEYSEPECPNPVDQELSLLELLELEAFNLVQHSGTPTECTPSSTTSSSKSSPPQPEKTTTSDQNMSSSSGGSRPIKSGSISQDGPNQEVKTAVKSNATLHGKAQLLRCILNAIAPGTFSVNPETLEKYRSCSGPGWNSAQHLKEHMQNVHTKQVKKVNPLQCNRCQAEFSSSDDLKSHELNVDCAIVCPHCSEEFFTKSERLEHQKENHLDEPDFPILLELDDNMWKQIKDNLKLYTETVKNKKGKISGDPDQDRERWVLANIPRFENGRSAKTKVNAKLELGQWYTMFKTLAPNMDILEHPFYDYAAPRSDYAEERILFIHETMINARVQANGLPPNQFDLQRAWYREALRDSLRIAAQTKKVSHIKGKAPEQRSDTLGSSQVSGSTPSTGGLMGYVAAPQVPQAPTSHNNVAIMPPLPQNYHHTSRPQHLQEDWVMAPSEPAAGTVNPSMLDSRYFQPQPSMTDSNGQPYPQNYNFGGQSQNNFRGFGGYDPNTSWQHPGGN